MQNALSSFKPFKDLKIAEELEIAKGRGGIDYDGYISLVQKVATNIDCRSANTRPNKVGFRSINNHEQIMDGYDYTDEFDDEDMDGHFGSLIINYNKIKNPGFNRRPSLPRDTWDSLSSDDKETWDRMSDKGN